MKTLLALVCVWCVGALAIQTRIIRRDSPVWGPADEEINAALSVAEHIDRESGEEPSPAMLLASRMELDCQFLEEICA